MQRSRTRRALVGTFAALALVATACGGGDGDDDVATDDTADGSDESADESSDEPADDGADDGGDDAPPEPDELADEVPAHKPELTEASGDHWFACFFPVGTEEGAAARADNEEAGVTAAGLPLAVEDAEFV